MSVNINPLGETQVFQPIKLGKNTLSHRVFFPPTTRTRSLEDHTPSNLAYKYYDERSKFPGTLIISEGTFPSAQAGLYEGVPGIWTERQTKTWKHIIDKIHENKSFASIQLWNLGRTGDPALLKKAGKPFLAPSAIYFDEESKKAAEKAGNPLRAMTEEEIKDMIYEQYTIAAKNALEAGFDYIELHSAHGYLLHEFLEESSNKRTDKYGGSIENRARFVLELVDHMISIVGAERLGIRISPWATFQGMKSVHGEVHPLTTYSYLVNELEKRAQAGNRLAYISLVEPRVDGINSVEKKDQTGNNDFVKELWKGTILKAGNYTYDAPKFGQLLDDVSDGRTLVGFSRYFISNPDLISRLEKGHQLAPYERETFYGRSDFGYNDYPKCGEKREDAEVAKKRVHEELVV